MPSHWQYQAVSEPVPGLGINEIIPGQGPDTMGLNNFSVMFRPRLPAASRYCYDPIEQPLDPDSFAIGNASAAVPDPMGDVPRRRPVPQQSLFQISPSSLDVPSQGQSHPWQELSRPVRAIVGQRPALEQRPIFFGSPPVSFTPDPMADMPRRARGRQQPGQEQERGDVSSANVPPPSMDGVLRRVAQGRTEAWPSIFAPQYFADQQYIAWWTPLMRPYPAPPPRQPGEQTPGEHDSSELGSTAAAGFISPPLSLPPAARRPSPNAARETLVVDPGTSTPDSVLTDGPLMPPARVSPFRPLPIEQRAVFVDVAAAGLVDSHLQSPTVAYSRLRAGGETFVQPVAAPAPPVIVGCELYTAVPVRPPLRSQPGEQLGGPYDPTLLGGTSPGGFISGPLSLPIRPVPARQPGEQAGGARAGTEFGPSAPDGFVSPPLAMPVFPPRRSPVVTTADVPEAPQNFQVLAGLDAMQAGLVTARRTPQTIQGTLVVGQQNFTVPDVSGYQTAWPMPRRSAPRPTWTPIETISTTVWLPTGNPPAFTGVGQVLVAATDLWVFAPTAATIEVSQRGNKLI